MADQKTTRENLRRLRNPPSVRVPGLGRVILPDKGGLLWYAGLGTMTAVELIEWPIAALVAGTHFIENHSHNRAISELAEGIDAGA